jgi:hypothetical protein
MVNSDLIRFKGRARQLSQLLKIVEKVRQLGTNLTALYSF